MGYSSAGERLNGIQEVSGSIPLISPLRENTSYGRLETEVSSRFALPVRAAVKPDIEVFKVNVKINMVW